MNQKFSILDRYGENFTDKKYVTNPAIGRDEQIKQLILVLLTPEKSAILTGKPGIGKTAIVEGLAYAIQQNNVPDALKDYSIINIKTASLLGTMPDGESKVQIMIEELKEKEKIILFIDEIHMLIGANDTSSMDFANIFKEGLGRGSIKVVGATTTDEYEKYILRDKAFTRRFQRVDVPEPTRDETIKILMGVLPKLHHDTGAKMKYTSYIQELIMTFIVDLTSEFKRVYEIGSRYPDVSLTLLRSAFSHAIYENKKEVDIFDVENAILNTKLVYPDVIKKDMPNFYERFKEIIKEEKENINNPKKQIIVQPIEEEQEIQVETIEPTAKQEEVEILDLFSEEIHDRTQYHKPESKPNIEINDNLMSANIEQIKEESKEDIDNLFDDFFE